MKRTIFDWRAISMIAAAALQQGCAGAREPQTADSQAVIAQLSTQAKAWDAAIVRKDRAAIEANMAEDFRQIDGAGNVETKSSFVRDIVSPDLQIDPYTVEDFDVRLYGDVALLSGRTRISRIPDQSPR